MKTAELYTLFNKKKLISTDSRKIDRGCIFFALKGENYDGNQYAVSAIEKGAHFAVIDNPEYLKGEKYILVDNTLKALQELANFHVAYSKPRLRIVGLTGSNGKTTTKELIANVLKAKFKIQYTEGNLNNHVGVPLTLLKIKQNTEIAIIEMGANHPGEIALLASIAMPDLGVITNIGEAHIEGFGSLEGVLNAKSELFEYINDHGGTFFINSNDQLLFKKFNQKPKQNKIFYGTRNLSAVDGKIIKSGIKGQKVSLVFGENEYKFGTKLIGKYNLDNFLAAAAIGKYFNIPEKQIVDSLSQYTPNLKRSQSMNTGKNDLLLDSYNANPTSMIAALQNFSELQAENKVAILGSMKELGKDSNFYHKKIVDFLCLHNFNETILIGEEFSQFDHSFRSFKNTNDFLKWLKSTQLKNRTILLKGSRANQLEKAVEFL